MTRTPTRASPRPRLPRVRRLALILVSALATLGASPAASAIQVVPEPAPASGAEPGAELRVWLVTAAPGTAIWERFGHNAIRVLDTGTGRDLSYNWGIFDFDQVDFVPRFLKGQMLYMMAAFPTAPMLDSYLRVGRRVTLQELALTPAQKAELLAFLTWNARPENRDYFYDYFLDNCSTRARDALDRVLGGALEARFGEAETGTSYRFHTRRLTQMDPLLYTGMDLLLGSPGDQPVTVWEEMFLPMTLMEAVREVRLPGPGGGRALVREERVLSPDGAPGSADAAADPDDPSGGAAEDTTTGHPWGPPSPPSRLLLYLALGLALGGTMAWSGVRAARASAAAPGARRGDEGVPGTRAVRVLGGALAGIWSVAVGLVGTVLILVLFTDHQFMAWNENLFLFTPLSLGLAVLAPLALAGSTGIRAARALAWTVVGAALLGLALQPLPAFRQENALFFALVLPVHLGLAWALERRASEEPTPARAEGPEAYAGSVKAR